MCESMLFGMADPLHRDYLFEERKTMWRSTVGGNAKSHLLGPLIGLRTPLEKDTRKKERGGRVQKREKRSNSQ